MGPELTMAEIEALQRECIDEDGNDIALARAVARMTPEERAQSEANLRAWVDAARVQVAAHEERRRRGV